jgi:uncharacterized peroxidase-related enzyme
MHDMALNVMAMSGGGEPDVMKIFFYRPTFFGAPMTRLTQRMLRGPSDWSIGERELFVAFVSEKNRCRFCAGAHCAVAAEVLGSRVVEAVMKDVNAAPITGKLRAMLKFLAKLALSPDDVSPRDIEVLRDAGISEEAIVDGIYLCMGTSVMNRIADALGCESMTPAQFAVGAKFLLAVGYDI